MTDPEYKSMSVAIALFAYQRGADTPRAIDMAERCTGRIIAQGGSLLDALMVVEQEFNTFGIRGGPGA